MALLFLDVEGLPIWFLTELLRYVVVQFRTLNLQEQTVVLGQLNYPSGLI